MKTLSHAQARRVYDRIGAKQDSQAFYEDVATDELVRNGSFDRARAVFELGCGTGRFAEKLLASHLPADATYRGTDVSPKMVELAQQRLARFGERANVALSQGPIRTEETDGSFDRFISNYVLDLLSDEDIRAVVDEAHRLLEPGGLLCVASLSHPTKPLSRFVIGVWSRLFAINPQLVGGCRPIELCDFVDEPRWRIRHRAQVTPFGLPSEALVAERV